MNKKYGTIYLIHTIFFFNFLFRFNFSLLHDSHGSHSGSHDSHGSHGSLARTLGRPDLGIPYILPFLVSSSVE